MKTPDRSKVPIDLVLLNVSVELNQLCLRLLDLEKVIFESGGHFSASENLKQIQDIDLIVQQIADLSRTVQCVTEAELSGVTLSVLSLSEKLHLKDLRDRLVGDRLRGLDNLDTGSANVHFF